MAKFKIGDMVVPKDGSYIGNTAGSPYNLPRKPMLVISYLDDTCMKVLAGANESPPVNPKCFDFATAAGPVRTVTRKEIVSGVYGIVSVAPDGTPMLTPKLRKYTTAEMRAAANIINELADFLDAA
ncbi:hypothetical protein [Mesorhizobium sp. NZP2298]|uniref:hypothetical protein n=1 Tax=Mesorhizobium sp. NZP2298 TaxID=2483403 RepID=UPI001556E828|nr:hypothetical protein [Mesorhizobium sp. NZP2298]QKC99156.1 hypothetical protein EB231_34770 [Mesorhizobium sp. NZP2298]